LYYGTAINQYLTSYHHHGEDQGQHTTLDCIFLGAARCTERCHWCNRILTLHPYKTSQLSTNQQINKHNQSINLSINQSINQSINRQWL